MALNNSQYDAIMREYGRQQIESHHKLEGRCKKIYTRLSAVKQLKAGTTERSVMYTKKLLERDKGVLDRLKENLENLWEQKTLIIRAADYPNDYLELYYRHPDYRDTGLIDGRKCHYFLQAQMKLPHAQFNPEDMLKRENFKTLSYEYYDDTEILPQLGITNAVYMRRAIAGCRAFIRDFDEKHDNLPFTGSTGIGKTFLTNCIVRELMDDFRPVIYLAANDLLNVPSRNKFDYDSVEDMKDMYRFILDCDLLITDDLRTELNDSLTSSQLFYCINERMNMSCSIITSTNLTLVRLRDSYMDRVTSRIMNGYGIIPLYGEDIGLLKK